MPKAPKILLVEDDPVQAEWIVDEIVKYFPDEPLTGYLRYFDSENKFSEAVPKLHQWEPQFALIDRSIHYYSVDDVKEIGSQVDFKNLPDPHMAWMRCREALLKTCPAVKVAVMTVHDDVDGISAADVLIQKGGESMGVKLGQFLRQIT